MAARPDQQPSRRRRAGRGANRPAESTAESKASRTAPARDSASSRGVADEGARDAARELLLETHPEVREQYERLRPRYDLLSALISARRDAGLTQAQLAERMGRRQGVISEIESGRRSPRIETLADAARAMGYELRIELVRRDAGGAGDAETPHDAGGAGGER